MEIKENRCIILFDGVCNLCNGFMQFVIKHDKPGRFKFSSLQSPFSRDLATNYYPELKEMKTIVYLRNGKMLTRSTAALYILKDLAGWPSIGFVFIVIPSFMRDMIYNWISARRYKFFGKREVCMVPDVGLKGRFL